MDTLGRLFLPEQYEPVESNCIVPNSALACEFFRNNLPKSYLEEKGYVILIDVPYKSIKPQSSLFWAYCSREKNTILSVLPVFKMDDEDVNNHIFSASEKIDNDVYFILDGKLYTIVTTDGLMSIKKVCAILSLNDVISVSEFIKGISPNEVFPCKVYSKDDGRFLLTCWYIWYREINNIEFRAVNNHDNKYFNDIDVNNTCCYPINIGEETIINDCIYKLCFKEPFGQYFCSQNRPAVPLMRQRENLILTKSHQKEEHTSQLKIVSCADTNKIKKSCTKAAIVNFKK